MQGSGAFLCLWEGESGASAHGEAGSGEPVGQDSLGVLAAHGQQLVHREGGGAEDGLEGDGVDALSPQLTQGGQRGPEGGREPPDAEGEDVVAPDAGIGDALAVLVGNDEAREDRLLHRGVRRAAARRGFEFDSQKDLYKAMLEDLSTAITDISAMRADEIAKLKSFDCWCNGDKDLWVKIANTMKLRMALRLSKRETEASNAGMNLKAIATEAAQNTLATVNKDILIDKSLENEMWLMFNWGDCGFNANLVTIMSGTKDPRQPLYMTLNTGDIKNEAGTTTVAANSQYLGIRFASGLPAKPNSWGSFSGWIQGNNGSSYSMPLPIMKAAEAYFLLAEAKLRWDIGSESVKNLYENGIRVSMTNELAYRGAYAGIKEYPEGAVDAYINGTSTQIDYTDPIKAELSTPAVNKLSVKWDESASNEEKLERIITQKWLALFPLSTEGWAEQRRTGYPRFFPAFVNESNGAVNTEEGVRRVIYSSQAYDANAKGVEGGIKLLDQENSSKFGISGDKGGTHLWWDNADKGNF